MNQSAVLLVQRYSGLQHVEIGRRFFQQIEFHTHMPEQRSRDPHPHAEASPSNMTLRWPDMRAQDLKRKKVRGAALDGLTIQRVIAVGRPDPVGAFQNTIIGAPAP